MNGPAVVVHCSRVALDVAAEASVPLAQIQLINYRFPEPPDSIMKFNDRVRLELCLTSNHRSARATFDHWRTQRYERLGDVFIMPPRMTMHVRSDETTPLTSVTCALDIAGLLDSLRPPPLIAGRISAASLDIRDSNIKQLLLRLAQELRQPGFASNILLESVATQLQVEVCRFGATLEDAPVQGGLPVWQLRLIEERIQELRVAPTLAELAALCHISVRQLTRGFRASRGTSIGAHVAARQMEHARRLLAQDHSIETIASILGFASSSNFCVAFRRAMGLPPGRFRQTVLRH